MSPERSGAMLCPAVTRLYAYVGPPEVAAAVRDDPPGRAVRSVAELRDAALDLDGPRSRYVTVTFVVDAEGTLRVADRSSEHVACAAGGPVCAAGELGIAVSGPGSTVEEASNQSTGFCPESGSYRALAAALDEAGIEHPGEWTAAFEFRRCESCGARTLVKDEVFECAECGAELPADWNF